MIRISSRDIDWNDDTSEDFLDRYNKEGEDVLSQFQDKLDKVVSWKKIPAARLKKIWNDYSKYGFVRDERGINEMAESVLDGIARLRFTTEVLGHEQIPVREVLESFSIDSFSKEDEERIADFLTDDKGAWYLSDYGLPTLMKLYPQIKHAKTSEDKLIAIDMVLNVVHNRSDLAGLFVEGGSDTLDELSSK